MATLTQLHDLEDHLDALIVSYLSLFDTYQTLQDDVSRHLSTGFISLAQANFSSVNRVRYGRDHYDQRMAAIRRVEVTAADEKHAFTIIDLPSDAPVNPADADMPTEEEPARQSGLRNRKAKAKDADGVPTATSTSTSRTATEKDTLDATAEKDAEEDEDAAVKRRVNKKDPIRMFGILTPPALKRAQTNFTAALPNLAALCSVLREIERQEAEVRRVRAEVRGLRAELGIVVDAPEDGTSVEEGAEVA